MSVDVAENAASRCTSFQTEGAPRVRANWLSDAPWQQSCGPPDAVVAKHAIDIDLFRVLPGRRLTLERHDPTNTFPFDNKAGTGRLLQRRVRRLYELTELLYAQNRWSVLFIFQALDGAGKD